MLKIADGCRTMLEKLGNAFDERNLISSVIEGRLLTWHELVTELSDLEVMTAPHLNKQIGKMLMDFRASPLNDAMRLLTRMRLENAARKLPVLSGSEYLVIRCSSALEGIRWALTNFWALTSSEQIMMSARRYCGEPI